MIILHPSNEQKVWVGHRGVKLLRAVASSSIGGRRKHPLLDEGEDVLCILMILILRSSPLKSAAGTAFYEYYSLLGWRETCNEKKMVRSPFSRLLEHIYVLEQIVCIYMHTPLRAACRSIETASIQNVASSLLKNFISNTPYHTFPFSVYAVAALPFLQNWGSWSKLSWWGYSPKPIRAAYL